MIPKSTLDAVQNLDITDVIGRYVDFKRKGAYHVACCPLHGEKTPSFYVHQRKSFFKCYGCGKTGDGISFIKFREKMEYVEAVLFLAKQHNIEIPKEEHTEQEEAAYRHREGLRVANTKACEWFEAQLILPENKPAFDYVLSRWNKETIAQFRIGFAPDGFENFKTWAKQSGFREEILLEANLLKESKGRIFDCFRNRVIFPILDAKGRVSGFTGRDFSGDPDTPKYFNTAETELYTKGEILYGLNFARWSAKEQGFLYLVEGNPDVMRLHQLGKDNTVGTCGTSLTQDQIRAIKDICPSVTIIGDSDKPGKKAMVRSSIMLIEAGITVNVVALPDESKEDPDSFFKDSKQFDDYVKSNFKDFIIYTIENWEENIKHPEAKSHLIDYVAKMISYLPVNMHEVYLEQVTKDIKPKKAWQDALKTWIASRAPEKVEGFKIPDTVKLSDYQMYGFYEDGNCYYFDSKNAIGKAGTNFIMEPLFHIKSILNAKRLFRITNKYGFSQVIELDQKDLISLGAFRLRIESLGNFLFEASEVELYKLKRFLYEKTDSCLLINQMGWQRQGFWAWSNGAFTDAFMPTNEYGIIKYEDEFYYLPASSNIYQGEESMFVNERRFKFNGNGKISLYDYTAQSIAVYGDNAMFGILFYMACLFRDYIFKLFGFFPILNLFGPKGAGKSEMAVSLLQFFGKQSKGPNLANTSRPALADHVSTFSNALCHIEEYRNDVEFEKIEFLKGLWDGMGRTKMDMEFDKKKVTSRVDAGVIISGQHMPTADIALYTRVVFLSFTKVEYTVEEKERLVQLKAIEELGLSHITHQILIHRKDFIESFLDNYQSSGSLLSSLLGDIIIEDRIYRNWLVLLATYRTLKSKVRLPFNEEHLFECAKNFIIRQNQETKKSNELSVFWSIVEFLSLDGLIKEGVDYKIEFLKEISTDMISKSDWIAPKNILFINHSRLFQLYLKHGNSSKQNILPIKTLEYYLQNCKEYLGRKSSVAFRVEDNGRLVEDSTDGIGNIKKPRKVTTAMSFEYDKLFINLTSSNLEEVESLKEKLPF